MPPASTAPTAAELIAAARALQPQLRAEQDEADRAGRYSPGIHRAMSEAGFFSILRPARYGGLELGFDTFYRVVLEIARGHPGAGWGFALGASHLWLFASHWPAEVQDEILGPGGDFIAPISNSFEGTCQAVEGGYRLDGQFRYASGAPYSSHLIAWATVAGEGAGGPRALLVPRSGYTLLEDWNDEQILGMAASGSQTVRLDGVFVPERHTIPFHAFLSEPAVRAQPTPGTALHGNPLYLGPLAVPFHLNLLAVVVGAARAAIDEYTEVSQVKKQPAPTFALRREAPEAQFVLGQAIARTDLAEAGLFHMVERFDHHCERATHHGEPFTVEDNLRLWAVGQQSAELAAAAVRALFADSGTSAARRGSRMARYLGDVAVYGTHRVASEQRLYPMLGRSHLGLPSGFFGLDG